MRLQCDAVVMQLEGHTKTASDVLQVLVESELHKDKVFVGVSNLMTWSGTTSSKPHKKKVEGEEGEGEEEEPEPADEEDAENPDRKEPLEVPQRAMLNQLRGSGPHTAQTLPRP